MATTTVDLPESKTAARVERTRPTRTYTPRVDIYETNDETILLADMPGVDENSVDITLDKNILTIEGRVNFERPAGYDLAYREYGVGDYYRTFALSDVVDRARIEATVKNGVLRLSLPKAEAARTRKIAVRAE
ncbi:MAG: Hsp20/alpha crystallin family protein [Chloroflexota bacterium]